MTSPELLRFFHAEAREYLDAVDSLVAGDGAFEAGAFVAAARALRGSATMARFPRVAEIALSLERIANGVRDGEINWSATLRRDLADAVSDLRRFVATSGVWSPDEDRRATDRLAALRALLPAGKVTPPPPPVAGTTPIFIALQSSAIATDLETFLQDSHNRSLTDDVVNRLRSLRGIAGVSDYPPLGDVADAVEKALRELAPDASLRDTDTELLTAAAAVFRRASSELRARGQFERNTPEVDRFARAAAAASTVPSIADDVVVRIEELFFTDAGPHLVKRGAAPSRSAEARFRDDVVTRAEHLRRLVAEARVALDPFSRERVRRDLKSHLGKLEEFAMSYGAQQVASVVGEAARLDSFVEPAVLDAIDSVARILTTPGLALDEMERRLAIGERKRWTPVQTPARRPEPTPAARPDTPRSGRDLHAMLGESLTMLASLDESPLAEPVATDDDEIVPIESLLYRGNSALERARMLRDRMRRSGSVDPEALNELYELLDLARAE
jgi:HPt (histidine-containing phosphotransfer) domain-containing protein